MSTKYTDGYGSVAIPREDRPGVMAEAVQKRWKNVKEPYPYGTNNEGGGGGGDS